MVIALKVGAKEWRRCSAWPVECRTRDSAFFRVFLRFKVATFSRLNRTVRLALALISDLEFQISNQSSGGRGASRADWPVHPFRCLTFFCLSPRWSGKRIGGKGMAALFSLAGGMSDKRFRVRRVFPRFKVATFSRPNRTVRLALALISDLEFQISKSIVWRARGLPNRLTGTPIPLPHIPLPQSALVRQKNWGQRNGGVVQLGRWNVGQEIPRFSAFQSSHVFPSCCPCLEFPLQLNRTVRLALS